MTTDAATPAHARRAGGATGVLVPWASVIGWGAGLLALALGAGALTTGATDAVTIAVGSGLAVSGVVALAWGAATLGRGRVLAPRTAVSAAFAIGAGGIAALAVDPAATSPFALAALWGLLVVGAVLAAASMRRGSARPAHPRVSALIVAAVVIAAVVTPALSATEAGHLAPDHGGHTVFDAPHH